jgi:23S rRNA (uracil1939-C5)-methyltransferase
VIAKLQWAAGQPEWPGFLHSLEIFTNEIELQLNVVDAVRPVAARFFRWCGTFLPRLVQGAIEYSAAGHTFRISRGSFFQVNRFLINELVEEVVGQNEGISAVDLYAGVGLFSSALGRRFETVDAVERSGPAYRDLEWNTTRSATNIHTVNASAEDFLRDLTDTPDLIVADPPRAGLGREATAELLRVAAPKLTIVSCDPATLARDVGKLLATYRIERLTLIDLFPRTYHFETVAHLERTA